MTLIPTLSIIIFSLIIGGSIPTYAASTGSITLAQTNGMDRRGDRRDDRQDCRSQEGVVGGDKRNCKQDSRGTDDKTGDADTGKQ